MLLVGSANAPLRGANLEQALQTRLENVQFNSRLADLLSNSKRNSAPSQIQQADVLPHQPEYARADFMSQQAPDQPLSDSPVLAAYENEAQRQWPTRQETSRLLRLLAK